MLSVVIQAARIYYNGLYANQQIVDEFPRSRTGKLHHNSARYYFWHLQE